MNNYCVQQKKGLVFIFQNETHNVMYQKKIAHFFKFMFATTNFFYYKWHIDPTLNIFNKKLQSNSFKKNKIMLTQKRRAVVIYV
jgi:hypothetical protein